MRKILFLFLLFFLSSCSLFKTSELYKGYTVLPLVKSKGMLFLNVTLNGKNAMLLIDTGSSKSILDINKENKYNFKHTNFKNERFIGIGGIQDIYIVYDYKIDGFLISMVGTTLEEITPYFFSDGIEIVGIIGSDFLNDKEAKIDYTNQILYIKNY
jgi:hypothetical protein